MIKNRVNAAAEYHPTERQASENVTEPPDPRACCCVTSALPQSNNDHEMETLWIQWGNQDSYDSANKDTHERAHSELLQKVARTVGCV